MNSTALGRHSKKGPAWKDASVRLVAASELLGAKLAPLSLGTLLDRILEASFV